MARQAIENTRDVLLGLMASADEMHRPVVNGETEIIFNWIFRRRKSA